MVTGFDRGTVPTVLDMCLCVPMLPLTVSRGELEFGGGGEDAGWLPEDGFASPTRLADVMGEGTYSLG